MNEIIYNKNGITLWWGNTLDVLKKLPSESVDCIITSPPYWCYAEGHEILTKNGWKNIKDIKVGDFVLSVKPYNLELEWVKVTNVGKWFYKGEMIHFLNTHIDLLVTPNHRMFVYFQKFFKKVRPREIFKGGKRRKEGEGFYFIMAKDIKSNYITPKTGFKWKGKEPAYFILPELKTVYNKQRKHYPSKLIKIKDWLKFFGLWLAEGSVKGSKGGKKNSYSISIKQKKPKDKIIRKLLKKLPFNFSETKDRDMIRFEISDKQLWFYLKQFGNSYTKYIPKEIKELSPKLLRIFLKWYLLGDGTIKRKGTFHEEISCYTVSKKLRDDLAEIALKIGKNTSIQEKNKVIFLRRRSVKLYYTKKIVNYSGYIYGVEVEKNHTLCVRRNNKIIFSGNSLRIYKTEPQIWGGRKNCKHEWINENTKQDNLRYRKGKTTTVGSNKNPNIYTNPHLTYYICSKCGAYKGHLGLEPDFNLYIEHLLMITAELKRVLKKTGSFWLNLGDAYASSGTLESRFYHGNNQGKHKLSNDTYSGRARAKNYPQKCMLMLPERIAIAMIEQGWILREKIIWAKQILIQKERRTMGSALPTSCKDRFNMTWEYLYHFTKKSKKYYSDLDSVRIPIQTFENRPDGFTRCREYGYNSKYLQEYSPQPKQSGHRRTRASEEEIKRYKGKFNNLSPEEAEMFNSPRARNLRQQEAKKQGLHTFYTHSRRSLPNKVLDPRGNHNGGPGSWRDFKDEHPSFTHPLGKNLPTVWLINPEPHNFSKEFGANCDHFACVTSDTEILTDEGWKKYTEIKKCNNLLVATYNLKTKKIEYQELLYIKEYDYDGNLIHIGNRDLDILITPNHRNIVVKKNNEDKIVLAKDLVDRDKIRVWAPVDYKIEYSIGEIWAELVGWIISEGHYSKEYKLIEIYQNVGENEKKIDYLLNKGKIYYKKHIRERRYKGQIKKQVTWYISHCAFVDWVYKNVPDKKLNKLLVSLPQNELKALMKGLILGDGCIRKDGRVSFIQKDKKCIDWFEILAMRCGFHTITSKHKHNNVWIVYLTKRESIGIRNTNGKGKSIQEVYYKGKIWCPRTPNGTWVAKRNGRIFITGNTFPESLLVIPIKFSTPEERIVLDPFCGTGTVGVVAQKLGRKFIGIDLNKDYLTQIAIPRIEKERTLFPIL